MPFPVKSFRPCGDETDFLNNFKGLICLYFPEITAGVRPEKELVSNIPKNFRAFKIFLELRIFPLGKEI